LVVEVHRVLRGQDETHPDRTRLLEKRQQWPLRGRLGDRRQHAEYLVHVHERPEACRAAQRPRPGQDLRVQEGEEERALGVAEMTDRQDGDARLAVLSVEEPLQVKRLTLRPGREARRGQEGVEGHGKLQTVRRREDRLEVHHSEPLHWRILYQPHEVGELETLSLPPCGVHYGGEKYVLAAQWVGIPPQQRQQARGGAAEPVRQRLGVRHDGSAGWSERREHRQRDPGGGPRGVNGNVGGPLQPLDTLRALTPCCKSLTPVLRNGRGIDR